MVQYEPDAVFEKCFETMVGLLSLEYAAPHCFIIENLASYNITNKKSNAFATHTHGRKVPYLRKLHFAMTQGISDLLVTFSH